MSRDVCRMLMALFASVAPPKGTDCSDQPAMGVTLMAFLLNADGESEFGYPSGKMVPEVDG